MKLREVRGGCIVSDNSSENKPEIILMGTGTELSLCEGTAKTLRQEGRRVRVVSLVCWRLFDRQPAEYKEKVLPSRVLKVGWREYVGVEGKVIGVEEFGASGAYLDTFKKYGFTIDNVTKVARSLLSE